MYTDGTNWIVNLEYPLKKQAGVCGSFGTLAVGLFGQRSIDVQYWSETTSIKDGLFFGGGFDQLLIQATGVGAGFVYVFGSMLIIFFVIKKVVGLRVSDAEQLEGLDLGEHGNIAYGGFVLESTGPNAIISGHQTEKGTPG